MELFFCSLTHWHPTVFTYEFTATIATHVDEEYHQAFIDKMNAVYPSLTALAMKAKEGKGEFTQDQLQQMLKENLLIYGKNIEPFTQYVINVAKTEMLTKQHIEKRIQELKAEKAQFQRSTKSNTAPAANKPFPAVTLIHVQSVVPQQNFTNYIPFVTTSLPQNGLANQRQPPPITCPQHKYDNHTDEQCLKQHPELYIAPSCSEHHLATHTDQECRKQHPELRRKRSSQQINNQ